MIIVLKPDITKKDEAALLKEIKKLGYKPHMMRGVERTVIGAVGDERTHQNLEVLTTWPGVENVMPVQKRYKLTSREAHKSNSTITVRDHVIGGKKIQIMAGPCSVESEKQLLTTAHSVKKAGATI
ncbi:MAG: 3-deoxy-7-phosphoheptulonate synthase, partial [Limisphaerales bacterium]